MKNFLNKIWDGLTLAGKIIFGLLLLLVIIAAIYLIYKHNKDAKKDDGNGPEITQNYEPNIGTPLPADTPEVVTGSGSASVTATVPEPNSGAVAGASTSSAPTNFVAPTAGVDPSAPVKYKNDDLKFAITLPAGTQVEESLDSVTFTSALGKLYLVVSVANAHEETLQSIAAQLQNSPTTSTVIESKFGTSSALKFSDKNYGSGLALVMHGKVYYLLGTPQYFSAFSTL